jgi:glyoxylase-like metal-dependent hydrolase (beta-lactamase superfamily II)
LDDLLIDTAQRNCEQKAVRTFEKEQINKILLTHWHEDHSGNTQQLATAHNAKIYAPVQCIQKLSKGYKVLPYERFLFGEIHPITEEIHPVPETIITKNHKLTPIFTPGHSEDHTVYLEEDKGWLFAGDLFVGVEINIFRKGEEFWPQVASFKKVLNYNFDVIFCGHHPRLENGKEWMLRKLQYFEDFGGRVRELHQQGYAVTKIIEIMNLKESVLIRMLTSNDVSLYYMVQAACKAE